MIHLLKMSQILTVSCKLEVSPQQVEKLDAVLRAFANCCECAHCNWVGDADENGAKNISILGLLLDQPGGSGLACSLEHHVLGLLKSPTSASASRGSLRGIY